MLARSPQRWSSWKESRRRLHPQLEVTNCLDDISFQDIYPDKDSFEEIYPIQIRFLFKKYIDENRYIQMRLEKLGSTLMLSLTRRTFFSSTASTWYEKSCKCSSWYKSSCKWLTWYKNANANAPFVMFSSRQRRSQRKEGKVRKR